MRNREAHGKTQVEVARSMGTTQSAIARAEAGDRMPTLGFIDRWARATGAPITLELGRPASRTETAAKRRAMVRSALGPGRFHPWERNPSPIEAKLLDQAGLTREHFARIRKPRHRA